MFLSRASDRITPSFPMTPLLIAYTGIMIYLLCSRRPILRDCMHACMQEITRGRSFRCKESRVERLRSLLGEISRLNIHWCLRGLRGTDTNNSASCNTHAEPPLPVSTIQILLLGRVPNHCHYSSASHGCSHQAGGQSTLSAAMNVWSLS